MSPITKTFLIDSEETAKELRYSLGNVEKGLISFNVEKNTITGHFSDEHAFAYWLHAHKAWFDKAPIEAKDEAINHD